MKKGHKILVVGAGSSQVQAIKQLNDLGFHSIAIDGDEKAQGLTISNESRVCDIKNSRELIKVAKEFQVNAITSFCTDIPMISISEACEQLQLPCLAFEQAQLSVNKYSQRSLLSKNEISTPQYEKFDSPKEALNALSKFLPPVVIKPVDSSGSRGVKFFDNFSKITSEYLQEVIDLSRSNSGIIESFIEGPELAVDGFVVDGDFKILSICEKTRTDPPHLLDTELRFPSNLPPATIKLVEELTTKIVKITNIRNSPIHIEMINSNEGPILVEFGARGAGFNVYDLILPYISGVDTIKTQISLALGEKVDIGKISKKAAILSFISSSVDGTLQEIPDLQALLSIPHLVRCNFFFKQGDRVNVLRSGEDRLGYVLSMSENIEDCENSIMKAKEMIQIRIQK